MALQQYQFDAGDNTTRASAEFQMRRSPYQNLLRRCNDLIDLRRLILLGKALLPGYAIDPSIAPMISEDDESTLLMKMPGVFMIA
jgi:hypothetical protein